MFDTIVIFFWYKFDILLFQKSVYYPLQEVVGFVTGCSEIASCYKIKQKGREEYESKNLEKTCMEKAMRVFNGICFTADIKRVDADSDSIC